MGGAGYSSSVEDLGPNLSSLYQSFGGISAPAVGNNNGGSNTLMLVMLAAVLAVLLFRK